VHLNFNGMFKDIWVVCVMLFCMLLMC
jgi:hypothetical protein